MKSLQINATTLESELDKFGNLPPEAVYLGTALDNLPVLYNLADREMKHLLIKCASRFPFETIKRARSDYQQRRFNIEFVMISNEDMYGEVAWQKVLSLGKWIYNGEARRKPMVIFIEELGNMLKQDPDCLAYFTTLLVESMRYPVRIITCSARRIPYEWEQFFSVIKETDYGSCLYAKDDYQFWTPV